MSASGSASCSKDMPTSSLAERGEVADVAVETPLLIPCLPICNGWMIINKVQCNSIENESSSMETVYL